MVTSDNCFRLATRLCNAAALIQFPQERLLVLEPPNSNSRWYLAVADGPHTNT